MREVVRRALERFATTPLGAADAEPLPADVNRGCREALLEAIKLHITGPLHSLEFIAKMGGQI
jgi:hypothetical protein